MSEPKNYEVENLSFELETDGSPYKGTMTTDCPEHISFTHTVALSKSTSRKKYAKAAAEHFGLDPKFLEGVLVELTARITEEVREARTNEEAQAAAEDPVPEVEQEEIDELSGRPGVLERFVRDAARCSGVIGERDFLQMLALVALSAQLAPATAGSPFGVNVMLTAPAGRGKNHVCDAVSLLLPQPFYYTFESASAKSFYYGAEDNPAFLKHRWLYPNEAEGVDLLTNLLRPLLSGGKARHNTVNKDSDGRNVFQEYELEGPVSTTIPTIRNKLDKQLGTRMLIADLGDYEGRVKAHSHAKSAQLALDQADVDHSPLIRAWQAACTR